MSTEPKLVTATAIKDAPKPAEPVDRTTTAASPRSLGTDAEPDTSPLMTRRGWIGLAWGAFTAASAAALGATGRFMFPNVLSEPPQQFRVGFPADFPPGIDERFKESRGVWIVRTDDDLVQGAPGLYALIAVCTHLGCTPNYLAAEGKFKCPCHGSGFRLSGINFEGPAPRPLERAAVTLADDGQVLVNKGRPLRHEIGQWLDPDALLKGDGQQRARTENEDSHMRNGQWQIQTPGCGLLRSS